MYTKQRLCSTIFFFSSVSFTFNCIRNIINLFKHNYDIPCNSVGFLLWNANKQKIPHVLVKPRVQLPKRMNIIFKLVASSNEHSKRVKSCVLYVAITMKNHRHDTSLDEGFELRIRSLDMEFAIFLGTLHQMAVDLIGI